MKPLGRPGSSYELCMTMPCSHYAKILVFEQTFEIGSCAGKICA